MVVWSSNIKFRRDDTTDERKYHVEDGEKRFTLPSVTTILSGTKDSDSEEVLEKWQFFDSITCYIMGNGMDTKTFRAAVGSKMHSLVEDYLIGIEHPEPREGKIEIEAYKLFKHYKEWIDSNEVEPKLIEQQVYWIGPTGLGFAGTVDLVAVVNGILIVVDHKTSVKPKLRGWIEDYELQVAAYAKAIKEIYGVDIKGAIINISVTGGKTPYLSKDNEVKYWNNKSELQSFEMTEAELRARWSEFYRRAKQYAEKVDKQRL